MSPSSASAPTSRRILTPAARHQGHRPSQPAGPARDRRMGIAAALLATLAVAALVGAVIGLPIVRMGGAAAVIATLGLLLIVHGIIIGASDFTRGANAFLGVPRMTGIWTALAIPFRRSSWRAGSAIPASAGSCGRAARTNPRRARSASTWCAAGSSPGRSAPRSAPRRACCWRISSAPSRRRNSISTTR